LTPSTAIRSSWPTATSSPANAAGAVARSARPCGPAVQLRHCSNDAAGFGQLIELLAAHASEPTAIEIAIEMDKGLLIAALRAAGFAVFAIDPRAVARYRERYGQAGGKSDPGDAVLLANILRTDRHAHRRLPADTELARMIKVAARSIRKLSGPVSGRLVGCGRCCRSSTRRPWPRFRT
jgi:transposase